MQIVPHPHASTGEPCYCGWGRPEGFPKFADDWYDQWLQIIKRKKFQKPEIQEILTYLENRALVNDRTVKWIPWLMEQIRQGNVKWNKDRHPYLSFITGYDAENDDMTGAQEHSLGAREFGHICDWLNSGHRTRQQAGNVEQLPIQKVHDLVQEWNADMEAQRKNRNRGAGAPLHTWDDGWTLRELGPHELKDEGDAMGHCVGGYINDVANGTLRVLSLRDPTGNPHVTTGIRYDKAPIMANWHRDPNGNWVHKIFDQETPGQIYQHEGVGNSEVKPEYNQRFAEYFNTLPLEKRPLSEEYEDEEYEPEDWEEVRNRLDRDARAVEGQPPLDNLGLPTTPLGAPPLPHLDLDSWHDGLVQETYYGRDRHHKWEWADTLADYLDRTNRWKEYEPVLQSAQERFYDTFDAHYYNEGGPYHHDYTEPLSVVHPMNFEDEDWEEEFEKHDLEDTPENRRKYESDWEDAEADERDYYMKEWPEYQAINNMYEFLNQRTAQEQAAQQVQQAQQPQVQAKVAQRTHLHITLGHPCRCPWGDNMEHLGSVVKTADKWSWLKERKDLQDEPAQEFLKWLNQFNYTRADKLLPWVVREWRKGRIIHPVGGAWLQVNDQTTGVPRYIAPGQLEHYANMVDSLKKHRKGIDVMQHTIHELIPKLDDHHNFLKEKERQNYGEVIHRFNDGWTIRQLQDGIEASNEGEEMGHCVGGYAHEIEHGSTVIASLRDQNNRPHATIELEPSHWEDPETGETTDDRLAWNEHWRPRVSGSSRVVQFQGKQNQPPLPEYTQRVNEWLDTHGIPPQQEIEPWWDPSYTVPGAETVREYTGEWDGSGDGPEPPDEYYQACAEAEEHGLEPPELDYEEPNFEQIFTNHTSFNPKAERWHFINKRTFDPEEAEELWHTAAERGHLPQFYDQYRNWLDSDYNHQDGSHAAVKDWWDQSMKQDHNPETGEFEEPIRDTQGGTTQWNRAADRWWEQKQYAYPQLPGGDWGEHFPPSYLMSKTASTNPPLYYRFAFSPDTGAVEIGHNAEDHPAKVRYHKQLAEHVNRPNLVHGYAYRIHGGWRLTDWEHRPLDDRFVASQVVRKINEIDPRKQSLEVQDSPTWEPAAHDFERLHYGLPQPAED